MRRTNERPTRVKACTRRALKTPPREPDLSVCRVLHREGLRFGFASSLCSVSECDLVVVKEWMGMRIGGAMRGECEWRCGL